MDGEGDDEIIRSILEKKKEYKILGTYAFVTSRKGLDQIIKVLPYLQEYVFIIIGEGPDIKELKLLSQKCIYPIGLYFSLIRGIRVIIYLILMCMLCLHIQKDLD